MRLIDSDTLGNVKFHPLPYTHITPTDANAESYKRGWNDAIDAIMSEAPTVEEHKTGKWVWSDEDASWKCGSCDCVFEEIEWKPEYNYCPNCGADMKGESNDRT